jgi:hypothetical protein
MIEASTSSQSEVTPYFSFASFTPLMLTKNFCINDRFRKAIYSNFKLLGLGVIEAVTLLAKHFAPIWGTRAKL